jgi:hypothetical protein
MKRPKQFAIKLDGEHRRKIEAAIDDGRAAGKLSKTVPTSTILEALDKAYVDLQISAGLDSMITIKDRERWTRILNLFDELASEFDEAKDYWFFQRQPVTEPVPDVRNMKAKNAASYAQDLQAMRDNCQRHLESISLAITARKGDRDRAREKFYHAVFDAWECGGGKLTLPTRGKKQPAEETGSPLSRFFFAVVESILGRETPKPSSFENIVKRARLREAHDAAKIVEIERVHLANRAKRT